MTKSKLIASIKKHFKSLEAEYDGYGLTADMFDTDEPEGYANYLLMQALVQLEKEEG